MVQFLQLLYTVEFQIKGKYEKQVTNRDFLLYELNFLKGNKLLIKSKYNRIFIFSLNTCI